MSNNLLERTQSNLNILSKSERKVAEVILLDPATAIQSSIASIAKKANVSEPTVNRFSRSMDCKGFPDFKLKLAQNLATGVPYINSDVEFNDQAETYTNKIFDGTRKALTDAQQTLDPNQIERIVTILSSAKKIEFYGLGGSGSVVMDAQHKFFRLDTPVIAHTDMLMQRMSAAVAGPGDAIVFVSNTGRTKPLIETAKIARNTGAHVIGITAANSPLSEICHISLNLQNSEDTEIYTPMTSRIVQLVVLDVIATGIALSRGAGFEAHLKKIKESIGGTRLSAND